MVEVASSNTSGRGLHRTGVLLAAVVGLLVGLLFAVSPAGAAGISDAADGAADGSPLGLTAQGAAGGTAATDGNTTGLAPQSAADADAVAYINAQNTGVVSQVSAGTNHTCAVTDAGYAYCWGYNGTGRLGNNTGYGRNSSVPTKVVNKNEFKNGEVSQVSAGSEHTCAVTTDGSVYCWGSNVWGNLGNGLSRSENDQKVPVRVKEGDGLASVTQVSAGRSFTCAVTTDGSVYCWGRNLFGQLGRSEVERCQGVGPCSTTPVKVAAGEQGNGSLAGVKSVSAGYDHACALLGSEGNGTVYCWGANDHEQLGSKAGSLCFALDPPGPKNCSREPVAMQSDAEVSQVSAGKDHTCAVTKAGYVYCWGSNSSGQLGNGKSGTGESPPVGVSDANEFVNEDISQVSAGYEHTCAVTTGNIAYCWGKNSLGELGNDTSGEGKESSVPVQVSDANELVNGEVDQLSAGGYHTCGVTIANYAYCWGKNSYGQLGNGDTKNWSVPIPVAGQIQVVPSSVEFGTVNVGDTDSESVTVKHSFPLSVGSVVVGITEQEGSREGFAFSPDSGCANDRSASILTLTGGQPCSGEVEFAPQAPGNYGGIVALTPPDYQNAGAEFAASGYSPGADPDGPVVKADAVDFGKVDVYTAKVATVKVKNTGDKPLKITGGKITSDPDDEFAADLDDCTAGKVAVGKSCTAKVQFFPRQGGESAALLELKSNAVGSATIALSGEGQLRVQTAEAVDEEGDPLRLGKVRKLNAPDKKTTVKKAQMKWKRPKGNATITGYQSRIKNKNGDWKKWSGKDPQPDMNGWISRGYKKLSPNTKYNVQVRAWSYDLKGPKDGLTFTTNRKGIPTRPANG